MEKKSFCPSMEMMTGTGLIIAGLLAMTAGIHDVFAQALAPFGAGLILSDGLSRVAKSARERVKVRIRRDD